MDIKLIFIIIAIVLSNSLLLFFLFWHFSKKQNSSTTQQQIISKKTINSNPHKEIRRFKFLIFILSLLLSSGIIYFLILPDNTKNQFLLSENSENIQKKEFYHNPEKIYPRGLNLIFFAESYPSWEEFDSDITNLMLGIKQIEPWKTYTNYNIYKVNPGADSQLCQIKTENERKPVLRCDAKINKLLEKVQLENFRLIVLSRKDFQSWANVSRLESAGIFFSLKDKIDESNGIATSYLFAHLLGHSFGLKDEEKFVIAKADGAPHDPDGPNCAPDEETAKKWWANLAEKFPDRVGYFKTCAGSDNFIKPTETSLMNFGNMEKFIPDYGPVSEEYLRNMLQYCFSEKKLINNNTKLFFEKYPEFSDCTK
ncbi:MAG: hypothetical protein WCK16_04325 [Candidatus Moraniibacteriota bacterium]